jgi:hypothetical protein
MAVHLKSTKILELSIVLLDSPDAFEKNVYTHRETDRLLEILVTEIPGRVLQVEREKLFAVCANPILLTAAC